jgi:hypothetical protein
MLIILIPLLVFGIGLFMYYACKTPETKEVGKIAIAVGLFWTVAYLATQSTTILGHLK